MGQLDPQTTLPRMLQAVIEDRLLKTVPRDTRPVLWRGSRDRCPREDAADADEPVIDALNDLVEKHPRWGFWKCFDRMRLDGQWWTGAGGEGEAIVRCKQCAFAPNGDMPLYGGADQGHPGGSGAAKGHFRGRNPG